MCYERSICLALRDSFLCALSAPFFLKYSAKVFKITRFYSNLEKSFDEDAERFIDTS